MPTNAKYVGAVVLEIDGVEIEVTDFSIAHETGRKAVKVMNRVARATGYAQGIQAWSLSFSAPILVGAGSVNWSAINKGKLTYWPTERPEDRKTLRSIFVTKTDQKFVTDSEATVSVEAEALGYVNE